MHRSYYILPFPFLQDKNVKNSFFCVKTEIVYNFCHCMQVYNGKNAIYLLFRPF